MEDLFVWTIVAAVSVAGFSGAWMVLLNLVFIVWNGIFKTKPLKLKSNKAGCMLALLLGAATAAAYIAIQYITR